MSYFSIADCLAGDIFCPQYSRQRRMRRREIEKEDIWNRQIHEYKSHHRQRRMRRQEMEKEEIGEKWKRKREYWGAGQECLSQMHIYEPLSSTNDIQ